MTWDIWYINEGFLIWIILSTYISHEAVSRVCTAGFTVFVFIGYYFECMVFFNYYYYIISTYIVPYYLCSIPPVSYFDHIIAWILPTWYHLLSLYLFLYACAHVTAFNTCSFDLDLLIHVCLSLYATWHSPHHSLGSFWLPWILMSRSWSLELVYSPTCWSE